MSEIETGGPAFPSTQNVRVGDYVTGGHSGMDLRDYFAAKAMAAFAASANGLGGVHRDEVSRQFGMVSDFSYLIADAMLAARSKP